MLFAGIGPEGQDRLLASRAVIIGCGAIGAAAANLLVRAGVGQLRIIDRDFVEPSNLQRQTLFDESDAQKALPKAVAAEQKLRSINSSVAVEGIVADLSPRNVHELLGPFDLLLDGTDNFETRFLINDFTVKSARPWIYAAAVASYGLTMTILPGQTACLSCLLETSNGTPGLEETCDTIGVLAPIVNLIASLEVAEALKLLSGHPEALTGRLISCDVWSGRMQSVRVARNPECRACARQDFTFLNGEAQPHITLCDRSRFSRRFISVRKVLRIRAFKSSVRCSPLVATRASRSPFSVMNRMISRWRSCGALPSAVSRRISAQLASSESVKCKTHSRCSAIACGASFLQPEIWQGVPIGPVVLPETIGYIPCAKNPLRFAPVLRIVHGARNPCLCPPAATAP